MQEQKLYILEKILEDGKSIELKYMQATDKELQDAYILYDFIRYSVNSVPVFKDNN